MSLFLLFLLFLILTFLITGFFHAVFSYPAHPVGNYLAIDLGSRFMRFGVYRDGQVEVIPNKLGQRQTTSAVAYPSPNDSTPLIADDSWSILNSNTTTFMMASFYERMEKQEKAYFSMNEGIRQSLTRGVKDLLSYAKGEAVNYLQESVPNVVFAIPSFTYYQGRQIIQEAAQQAGFTNSYFITAPAAVALAYTQSKPSMESENHQTILQVDFGFHHLHVSINLLLKNESTVIAAVKKSVGGINIIANVQKYYENQLLSQGISETNLTEIHLKCFNEFSRVVHELSDQKKVRFNLTMTEFGLNYSDAVSRATLEGLNIGVWNTIQGAIEQTLTEGQLKISDIDEIVLIGGASRIPQVQRLVKSLFNKEPINGLSVDETVLTGAVLQSGILSIENEDYPVNLNVTDVLQWDVNIKHGATSILKIPRASVLPISSEVNDVNVPGFTLMSMYVNGISLRGNIAFPYINETSKSETCNVQFEINASNEGKVIVTNVRSKQSKISTFKL